MTRTNSTDVTQILSKQELDCMLLLASGKNIYEIAVEKQRSEFSINFYIRNARKKLRANNSPHLE